ncbi:MAG: mechanosensitive ion channel protein MscL [Chloroflexi bacterium RBG_16_47_49]|nr:MAG: mechanosensitive ion channel protein MscL [Chloroflexi bacterium RBG_16_47_49]
MFKEFKEFAFKGNMIDLAFAVIIGGAFGKIITSLVNDIIMPLIGQLLGNANFKDLFISLNGIKYASLADAQAAGAATFNYGMFINTIIDFLIVAFIIFLIVRQINRMKKAPVPTAPTTKECPHCFTQIPIPATRCPNCTSELK